MTQFDPTTMTIEEAMALLRSGLTVYLTKMSEQVQAALDSLNSSTPAIDPTEDEDSDDLPSFDDDEDEDEDDDWDDLDDWDDDEEPEAPPTPKFAVGDIVECPACGQAKVLEILPANEGYVRYELEGIGKHYEMGLTKVETPEFKVGDWVRGKLTGHVGRIVGTGERFPSGAYMYSVYVPSEQETMDKYSGGLERTDWPAPRFQVGQRVIINWAHLREAHAVITAVSIDEDGDYRFDLLTDDGKDERLFDFGYGLRESPATAHNLMRLEWEG